MEKVNVPEGFWALGWSSAVILLLSAAVCWAAGSGEIPLNGNIGLRFPPLTNNAAAWESGHAAGARPALVAFVVSLISCLVGLAAPLVYWLAVAALIGGLIWIVVSAVRAAKASGS